MIKMNVEKPKDDFDRAIEYFYEVKKAYIEIGEAGKIGLLMVLAPIELRIVAGERTEELFDEIMSLE
jgi:hypothetical protein